MSIARTPPPPYYAVIFSSVLGDVDDDYARTAARMLELAARQPGFLGVESAREQLGITVSYWKDLRSIRAWRDQAEHTLARQRGREAWYACFTTRIARVERDYTWQRDTAASASPGGDETPGASAPPPA